MTPEDFDLAVKKDPQIRLLNQVTIEEDGYQLFGLSLADYPHFKYEDINGDIKYTVILDVPATVQCNPCGIEYKTNIHDGCPLCKVSTYDLFNKNRLYMEEWREFEAALSSQMNMRMELEQPLRLFKHAQISQDTMESMVNEKAEKWSINENKERLIEPEL